MYKTDLSNDIVSIKREDEPLIFISEDAINLKRNNDELKQKINESLEINQKLQSMGILDSRAILWLSKQEKILKGSDKE